MSTCWLKLPEWLSLSNSGLVTQTVNLGAWCGQIIGALGFGGEAPEADMF